MKSVSLTAYPRTLSRRNGVRKLRTSGRVPAVIYGRQTQPQSLEVTITDLDHLIHHSASENILVDLVVKDDTRPSRLALVQEVQHHVLSGKVLHVDFHEVSETEKVTITVPVESTGEAVGVKSGGGVLEHVLFKVKVRALPKDLPELLTVDVSKLEIGQAIHIGDLAAPAGVEILGDKHITVLAVAAPVTEAEEAAATAAAATPGEVEVIKEKKDETGEGAAAPAKAGDKTTDKGAEKPADKGAEKKAEKKK
ncbi:MAG: 50S ribosomal protein L25 [Verrucomicrobia bacterium]|nr:50S ribosomal protein L25 [Verrucomicrobiota bacterium]